MPMDDPWEMRNLEESGNEAENKVQRQRRKKSSRRQLTGDISLCCQPIPVCRRSQSTSRGKEDAIA